MNPRLPHRFLARLVALIALAASFSSFTAAQTTPRLSLMHGFADMASMTLWAQTDREAQLEVELAREGASDTPQRIAARTTAGADHVAHIRLANLQPATAYRYRVFVDGSPARDGHFRTQPFWPFRSEPPDFAVAVGSCAYINDPFSRPGAPWGGDYRIFDAIAAKAPDFMLWLGDNVYFRDPEWTSREGMSARYRAYRELPELATLWTATSHLAVWDDHDFGPNDSDGSFVGKQNALETFRRYWPNPTSGLPEVPGVFAMVSYGDADFFLLDDRFHRYPDAYPDVAEKTMLGRAQFEWLKRSLVASRATFKVVAAGGQFWNRANRFEGLHQFPAEQKALREWLDGQKIAGVVFVSGDRHFGELLRIERPGTYPLYELTSSPLTAGVFATLPDAERNNPDLVPGTLVVARHFAMLRISGPRKARVLAFEAYDTDGKQLWRREVKAAELRE